MQLLSTSREAKEFLIDRIVSQAQLDGVPMSEIERKMLYFSETGWTLPDMAQVNDEFDRHYNQREYERKIAKLVKRIHLASRRDSEAEQTWTKAVRCLNDEDHYILALIATAGVRPRGDFAKVVLSALVIVAVIVAAMVFFSRGA